MTRVSGLSPLPVAEVAVGLLLAWLLFLLPWWREPGAALLRTVRGGALLFLAFQLLWGVQYARPGLEARLGLPVAGTAPHGEVEALARALVLRTNALYRELHGSDDAGAPTPRPTGGELRILHRASLDARWAAAAERWGLPPAMARARPGPRYARLTPALRWSGIAGVFVPWTGEGLVMSDLAGAGAFTTLAHESAHQRGVARESDANALAYLLALEAGSGAARGLDTAPGSAPGSVTGPGAAPEVGAGGGPPGSVPPLFEVAVRYSAALFLQRQALFALGRVDPRTVNELVELRSAGVQRDVVAMVERSRAVEGPVRRVATRANDAMLRGHGIEEGVASYAGSLWIVLALSREHGVDALLP
jgi:hypothetical protein